MEDDLAAVEALAEMVHRHDDYPTYLPGNLRDFVVSDDTLEAWVAEQGQQIVGHAALHASSWPGVMKLVYDSTGLGAGQLAVVARLFVSPSARHRGVGHALLDAATAEAWKLGRRPILDVVTTLSAALRLYEKAGWRRIGTVQFQVPGGRSVPEHVFVGPVPSGEAERG